MSNPSDTVLRSFSFTKSYKKYHYNLNNKYNRTSVTLQFDTIKLFGDWDAFKINRLQHMQIPIFTV